VTEAPGRSCPRSYRYGAEALAACRAFETETLWVAGGLYGNRFALERLLDLFDAETGAKALVFNGDFHWFDCDAAEFGAIDAGTRAHLATRGNVETELADPGAQAGCGCAYPEWVDDAEVARSNRILERLRAAVQPQALAALGALPMYRVAEVAGTRVAIVHGDGEALAGWDFSQERLAGADGVAAAREALRHAQARVFASSHTCLPVLRHCGGDGVIVNNGAAGMPNFRGTRFGLATRISVRPRAGALYGARLGRVHVEAQPLAYDHARWLARFLELWPEGSDAHLSYYGRMVHGPAYDLPRAQRVA
jgi:hypothetical protein